MRKHFLAVFVAFVFLGIAGEARACQSCIYPPPYRPKCGSSICGGTECLVIPDLGCLILNDCSENDSYCKSSERSPEQIWACGAPASPRRLTLVAVRLKRGKRHAG
jgi:hypothetical protein